MLLRFVLFGLVFYMIYFFVNTLFVKPFKQGYAAGNNPGNGQQRWKNPFQKEGDVTVITDRKERKLKDDGVGDYVDYEEVKD
jgi:hypothetical protein